MKSFRLVTFTVLLGVVAFELYSSPPSWWWMVKPLFAMAFAAITAMPPQTQFAVLAVATVTFLLVGVMRRWGLHILLLIVGLSFLPGIGFASAMQILFWGLPVVLVLRLAYLGGCKAREWHRWRKHGQSTVVPLRRTGTH